MSFTFFLRSGLRALPPRRGPCKLSLFVMLQSIPRVVLCGERQTWLQRRSTPRLELNDTTAMQVWFVDYATTTQAAGRVRLQILYSSLFKQHLHPHPHHSHTTSMLSIEQAFTKQIRPISRERRIILTNWCAGSRPRRCTYPST